MAVKMRRDDSGFSLVEMIVAMGIFGVLLAIFATTVQSFSATTVRTLRTSDQSTESRVAFNLFDKQVRAASAISQPGLGLTGLNWYVEYRDDAEVPSTCTQWVVRTDTDVLATRKWTLGATTAPAWRTVGTHVTNTTATVEAPFGLVVSTTLVPQQQLSVSLRYQQAGGPLTVNSSIFAARNSAASDTNGSVLICNSSTWRP